LTPFHLGVVKQLRKFELLSDSTSVAGASGGAIAAVFAALPVNPSYSAVEGTFLLAKDLRQHGVFGRVGYPLEKVLEGFLPNNAHDYINKRAAPCYIAYTEVSKEGWKGRIVHQFDSKNDLKECIIASCNVPFYLYGSFSSVVRGKRGIDGFFASNIPYRCGCPETGKSTEIEILVLPFSAKKVRLSPWKIPRSTDSYKDIEYCFISPDLLDKKHWPFSTIDIVQMALTLPKSSINPSQPISDDELLERNQFLHDAGMEAVNRWYDMRVIKGEKLRYNEK
jgi:hypothetical protein